MLKKDVVVGRYYAIAHTSYQRLSVVRIDSYNRYGGYNATKLTTNRTIRIKSAAKLRCEVVLNPYPEQIRGKWISVEALRNFEAQRQEQLF